MRILAVGDVHATDYWKEAFDKVDEYDHIVQLGDWFDSFHNDWEKFNQIDNFYEAIEYKKKHPDKIHLLIGNHDLNNYVIGDICSGHQDLYEKKIKCAIENAIEYFDIGVELGDYVFSHAGFSNIWMKYNNFNTLLDVNAAFHKGIYEPFRFNGVNLYGDDMSQGPTWIRPSSLVYDQYFKKQIVGHTEISDKPIGFKSENQELIIVDCRLHNITYEVGDKYETKFKFALFRRCDKVRFKIADKILSGVVEIVDEDGAYGIDETSYDIMAGDILCKHIPQSKVFI